MFDSARSVWAVAIPVELRFEGDARPGDVVRGFAFDDQSAAPVMS